MAEVLQSVMLSASSWEFANNYVGVENTYDFARALRALRCPYNTIQTRDLYRGINKFLTSSHTRNNLMNDNNSDLLAGKALI
jgi:hypothetical protein